MKADHENQPTLRRGRRRRLIVMGALSVAALSLLALPVGLGTATARAWIVARANRLLAPGKLELGSLRFSWIGSTTITGLVLRDAQGEAVLAAPKATWDRNLFQILFARPNLGTLRLDRAEIDAERTPSGAIDLYETISPLLGLDPNTALRIEVPDGRLKFRAEGLMDPVVADKATASLTITAVPGPVSWRASLAKVAEGGNPAGTLDAEGRFYRGGSPGGGPELEFSVASAEWPWAFGDAVNRVAGSLQGKFGVTRQSGHLMLDGKASLSRVEASGDWLKGDVLRVNEVKGDWSIESNECALKVKRLAVDSSLLTLKMEKPTRIVGRLDLAALASQLPRALRLKPGMVLDQGVADLLVLSDDQGATCGMLIDASAKLAAIRAHEGDRVFLLRDPGTLRVAVRRLAGAFSVESVAAETPYFKGEGRGTFTNGVAFTGALDLGELQQRLRDVLDFGAVTLTGRATLSGGYKAEKARYRADARAVLSGLKLVGVGPLQVVSDAAEASAVIEGAADALGNPLDWQSSASNWKSGEFTARLQAKPNGPHVAVTVAGPLQIGAVAVRAEGTFETQGAENGFTINPLVVTIRPDQKDDPRRPITFSAVGRYDREAGVLSLSRGDDHSNALVALKPEGVRLSGLGGVGDWRLDGNLMGDLSALAPWVQSAPEGLTGVWSARGTGRSGKDGLEIGARLDVNRLSWGLGEKAAEDVDSFVVALRALLPNGGKPLEVSELSLSSRFVTVEAAGRIENPGGTPIADLQGSVTPNWENVTSWLASHVESGAGVRGVPRAFRVRTPLGADWRRALEGEAGVVINSADVYGLKLGKTAIVLRSKNGETTIEPIVTTLNGGPLRLDPSLKPGDGDHPPALVLGAGSSLMDAAVNDEVSQRVLSYIAPVMNRATRVNGRVSADISQAVIPLRLGAGKSAVLKGQIVFHDVEFTPAGIVRDLLARVGLDDVTLIRINQPVALEIADRRVYQRGLVVPIGKLSQIEIDGWVGFDRDLNLSMGIPVLPTALADAPVIGGIAARSRLRIPVRGTLDRPEIDSETFKAGMKDLGKSVLAEGVPAGVFELLKRFNRRRAPNAPPPPPRMSPRERRRLPRGNPTTGGSTSNPSLD